MDAEQLAPKPPVEILEFLQQPEAYPNQPKRVDMRQTHISWVFLAGRYAYKLKKPVRFDFLDFSTSQRRREACESELRLNRRLSPSVYRAVVPVRRQKSGKLTMAGGGQVVDWLVKMRRLDDGRTLEAVLTVPTRDANTLSQIRAVASRLAEFYATQAPLTIRTSAFRERLRRHIDQNEQELLQITSSSADDGMIHRVHAAQKRFLVTHQGVFDDRVRDGRIVDGHGDLRPEHIYLYSRPLVIDCIEFNADYRTNDIVDELAFLAMECDRLGDRSVGRLLFAAYASASHDIPLEQLVTFYKAYRACVRAKVAALRSQQQRLNQASSSLQSQHDYLRLAENYTGELGPRLIILVGGLTGTGKSTLADQLGKLLSAEVIHSDMLREQRSNAAADRKASPQFGTANDSPAARLATSKLLMAAAASSFERNEVVVLDATVCTDVTRGLALQLADSCSAQLLPLQCTCPRRVAMKRIAERTSEGTSSSAALPEWYDLPAADAAAPSPSTGWIEVDTTLARRRQEEIVLAQVRSVLHQAGQRNSP